MRGLGKEGPVGRKRLFDDVAWPTRGDKHGAQHLHERGSDYAACGRWVRKPGTPLEAVRASGEDGGLCQVCVAAFLKLERAGEPVERTLRPLSKLVRGEIPRLLEERAQAAQETLRERRFAGGLVRVRPSRLSRPSGLAERAHV